MKCTIISDGSELLLNCKNEFEPPYRNIKFEIMNTLSELYHSGYDTFYLNCEYGIPLWCAETITAMKMYNDIQLNIVIPYEEQTTDWQEELRNRYFKVHAAADSVYLSSTKFSKDCYHISERYMIEHSDLLLLFSKESDNKYYSQNPCLHIIQKSI